MRLYNTLTRELEEVRPVEPGHVKMYACGPTVYRTAHLGNFRTYMLSDLIRRALELEGFTVTLVMNITDVGHMTDESSPEAVDKMLLAVEDEGLAPLEIAEKYTRAVFEDAEAVGIRPPDVTPKATEHIPEMIEITETLVEKEHAYVVDSGSVYFDVTSFPDYGKLSGNTLDNLREGHRDLETDPRKRHAADFALVEGGRPGPPHEVAEPVGRRVPRVARRVLRDVHEVPRRPVRHPHGRQRPAVPAPRGRDRAVRGRGRARGRVDLGARRPPAPVGAEDREVDAGTSSASPS